MASDDVVLDLQRPQRIGFDEAILCQGKSTEQLVTILEQAEAKGAPLLLTRLARAQLEALPARWRQALDHEPVSRTAYLGPLRPLAGASRVAVVAAGTSDAFVTREVERTLTYLGYPCTLVQDVGVAGLWRLLERLEHIRAHPVVVAVAGLDAALPTVLGGLVGSVLIAVPVSTGYGVAEGGRAALHAILSSCAPGVVTLNIDNGYGAACAAVRVLRALDRAAGSGA
jgi:pyridinium-3,5-biscarboxylic acid mononucleotide synthase